ncbi:MAG: hypothetical protein LUD14_02780 [Clostridiales bacterium]|nr:hypothetical protein [Clostridiales bacterium]
MVESENMQAEEYEDIKAMGWDAWQKKFIAEKCDNNWENLKPFFEANPRSYAKFYEAGIPCICDFLMITPFEYFCGGRSLEAFFMDDLMEEPELMHEIFDMVHESNLKTYRQQIIDTHALGDVPCELMSFGTPEEVKDYVTKLLEDIGPWGCMVATGCDIPSDAKPENVKAMSEAAHEFLETHPQK